MGIFKKFFNTIITVGFIPIIFVILAIIYYQHFSKKNLINNYQRLCDSFAISSYESINNFAKRLDYLYYLREVHKKNDDFLAAVKNKYSEIEFIAILDYYGREKIRQKDGGFSKLFKKIDISSEEYLDKLKKNREGVIGDFRIIKNIPLSTIVYPVDNDFVYVVVNLKKFFSYIYSTQIGESGFVFFISENGVILSDKEIDINYSDLQKIIKNYSGNIEAVINGDDYICVFRKIADLDISVVISQKKKEFFREINLIFYSLLFVIFFVLTISYIIALKTSNDLIMPIAALIESSKNVANGIFDSPVLEKSEFSEINELISVFNKMSEKIGEYSNIQIEKIMDEREKLNIITQNLHIAIVLLNMSGEPVYLNPEAKKIMPENNSDIREVIYKIIQSLVKNKTKIIELNKRYFEINIDIIKLHRQNPVILLVADDITLEVNIQKMKEDVFRSIAHDIRSPLLNMQGYIKLLSYSSDEKIIKYAKGLKEESDIVFRMIENIIDISRIEDNSLEIKLQDCDITKIMAKLAERFEVRAETKNIKFEKNIPNTPLIMKLDEELISRAIENILTNAFKYTEPGGEVKIEVSRSDRTLIVISDTGKGIEKDKLGKIFERFKSFSKDGFGLGLSIAKTIVEMHNGFIKVESEPNKGTKFTVVL